MSRSHPRLPVGKFQFSRRKWFKGPPHLLPFPSLEIEDGWWEEGDFVRISMGFVEIPVVSLATQIFGICETESSPLISALFSISAKTLYFAARNSPSPPISSSPVAPSLPRQSFSLLLSGIRKHLGVVNSGGVSAACSPRWMLATWWCSLDVVAICIPRWQPCMGCLFTHELFVRPQVNFHSIKMVETSIVSEL